MTPITWTIEHTILSDVVSINFDISTSGPLAVVAKLEESCTKIKACINSIYRLWLTVSARIGLFHSVQIWMRTQEYLSIPEQ